MKRIKSRLVGATFIAREISKNPKEFRQNLKKILKAPQKEWCKIGKCEEYQWSFDDLFLGRVRWYETKIKPDSDIVNLIFDHLLNIKRSHKKTIMGLIEDYKKNKLKKKDKDIINKIRKNLKINPRVIALTTDKKTIAIYDGWHTAMAFILENKKIPAYLGIEDSFKCYR